MESMLLKVPVELTSRRQWCLWKAVSRGGEPTKTPFQPNGQPAKSNEPATWCDFDSAVRCVKEYEGVGFVFSPDDPFVGIDLDGCRDVGTGAVEDWAREIILRFDSYSEVSPSGTGVKIFCVGEWKFDRGRKCTPDGRPIGGKQPGIEVYSQKRYFAVTGKRLGGVSGNVELRQDEIYWLIGKYFSDPPKASAPVPVPDREVGDVIDRARKYIAQIPGAVSGQRGHDRTFHVACALVMGFGLPEDTAFALLSEWNAKCEPPWTEGELRHKVGSAANRPGDRNYLRYSQAT